MSERKKLDILIEQYIEGSRKYYPELRFSSQYSMYSGDEPKACEFQFGLSAKNLASTAYDCEGLNQLIHYTPNFQNVIEILNSGIFRLSNLTNVNDPQEIFFTNRYLGLQFSDKQISEFKSYFFFASFCAIVNYDYPDDFPLWRYYGNDGYGAAIIFSVENPKEDWDRYLMARVQYGDGDAVSDYKDYIEWHNSFQRKNDNPILNQPDAITALMALHKNQIWVHENEIRLLTHHRFDKYTLKEKDTFFSKLKHAVSKTGRQYSYIEMPLYGGEIFNDISKRLAELDYPGYLFHHFPILKVTDIILGYRVSDEVVDSFTKILIYFSSLYGYHINLRRSYLADYM